MQDGKIWMRFGGYVTADKETMNRINGGDTEALMQAIGENGIELDGETYIPDTDIAFNINKLTTI